MKVFVKENVFYREGHRKAQQTPRPARQKPRLPPTGRATVLRTRTPCGYVGCSTRCGLHTQGWGPHSHSSLTPFLSRAVSGVDADPDLVHMEVQDLGGGKPGGGAAVVPWVLAPQPVHDVQWLFQGRGLCTADLAVVQWA